MNIHDERLGVEDRRRFRGLLRSGTTFVARTREGWEAAAESRDLLTLRMRGVTDWQAWQLFPNGDLEPAPKEENQ